MPTESSPEQPAPADVDLYYASAVEHAAKLQIPGNSTWAYLWTPREISKTETTVYLLTSNMLTPNEAVALYGVPFSELRPADGFAFKLLGELVVDVSPECWLVKAPPTHGGANAYLCIRPWYVEVPIRLPGPTIPNSQPDAVAVRQRWPDGQIHDRVIYVPGHPRPSGQLIDRALAVLDMRVRTGRPPDESEAVRLEYLAAAKKIIGRGDNLTRDALAHETALTPEWTYERMKKHHVSIRDLKRALRES